ncbi:hypothetical protein KIPB_010236 [Kipferlia bialata]|uniref:Uncharacterized protein n=1 Tax=Kipferlia bialata TaxID=797122 RepID=A0A9K3D2S5_9EUKA|nr:hypothetical protein KIPB_010236 [Kipferlia bialata]|eukprot:g10236.t1
MDKDSLIKRLQGQVARFRKTNMDLEKRLEEASVEKLAALKNELAELNREIGVEKAENKSLRAVVRAKDLALSQLIEVDPETGDTAVDKFREQLQSSKHQIRHLQQENDKLRHRMKQLQNREVRAVSVLGGVYYEVRDGIGRTEEQGDESTEVEAEDERERANRVLSMVKDLKDRLDSASSSLKDTTAQSGSASQSVVQLQRQLGVSERARKSDARQAKMRVAQLESEVQRLNTQLQEFSADYESLCKQVRQRQLNESQRMRTDRAGRTPARPKAGVTPSVAKPKATPSPPAEEKAEVKPDPVPEVSPEAVAEAEAELDADFELEPLSDAEAEPEP